MGSELDAIIRILEAFERSGWQEIDVRSGDLRVHLAATEPIPEATGAPVAPTATTRAGPMSEPVIAEGDPATTPPKTAAPAPPGAQVVTAPSPGVFWRAPEPGAPPFTDVGQAVEPASTLCIIEVMKLMNHVKAGVRGRVVAIYVENGDAVAKDEPLFAVVAEGQSS